MLKFKALKKTELFGSLSQVELRVLAAACVNHKLKKGEILFRAGENSKGLYVIVQGSLRAFRENAEGREQVIHVEKAVTTIAEVPVFDDQPYPSTVMAEEDSEVLFISKSDMRRFCLKHPAIALAALKVLAGRLRKTAELVQSLSLMEVDQRLALYLLQEFKDRGGKGWKLPTNSAIASRLGSVREVVSRAFSKLMEKGFISIDARRQAVLLDEKGLRDHAGR